MPRVLLTGFCAVPGPRRAGVQLRHVIRALTPQHNLDLLVLREGEQAYVERQGAVRVLRVPTHEDDPRAQIQAFQRALRRQLDGADYDIVHCRDSWSCMPVLEARERHGFAVVYDLARSPLGETTGDAELDAQYGRDEEACLLAADLVLAPTAAAVKALASRGKPGRVVLSPPGVDVDRFDWETPAKRDPVPRVMYVGTLDPGRGIRVLVRAFSAVLREVDARLVLAGALAPRFEATLRDTIGELGIADKVEIIGPVDHDQLPALYATATVCVVPAAADLSPNPTALYPTKLLEYAACKRAIVAPRRETVQHVVDGNREALLFEPGDPIDLARKVLRLLGEPQLRDHLATAAYERVRHELTASAARRALRGAYDVLAERFAGQFAGGDGEPAPKPTEQVDHDDTVFEAEQPPQADVDTSSVQISIAHSRVLDDDDDGDDGDEIPGEIYDRPRRPTEDDAAVKRAPRDEWIVTTVAVLPPRPARDTDAPEVDDDLDGHDDGTPIEGSAAAPPAPVIETAFVAGEIDVPPPRAPTEYDRDRARDAAAAVVDDLASVEFSAAGAMLGQPEADPDTGSRTPPLERR